MDVSITEDANCSISSSDLPDLLREKVAEFDDLKLNFSPTEAPTMNEASPTAQFLLKIAGARLELIEEESSHLEQSHLRENSRFWPSLSPKSPSYQARSEWFRPSEKSQAGENGTGEKGSFGGGEVLQGLGETVGLFESRVSFLKKSMRGDANEKAEEIEKGEEEKAAESVEVAGNFKGPKQAEWVTKPKEAVCDEWSERRTESLRAERGKEARYVSTRETRDVGVECSWETSSPPMTNGKVQFFSDRSRSRWSNPQQALPRISLTRPAYPVPNFRKKIMPESDPGLRRLSLSFIRPKIARELTLFPLPVASQPRKARTLGSGFYTSVTEKVNVSLSSTPAAPLRKIEPKSVASKSSVTEASNHLDTSPLQLLGTKSDVYGLFKRIVGHRDEPRPNHTSVSIDKSKIDSLKSQKITERVTPNSKISLKRHSLKISTPLPTFLLKRNPPDEKQKQNSSTPDASKPPQPFKPDHIVYKTGLARVFPQAFDGFNRLLLPKKRALEPRSFNRNSKLDSSVSDEVFRMMSRNAQIFEKALKLSGQVAEGPTRYGSVGSNRLVRNV